MVKKNLFESKMKVFEDNQTSLAEFLGISVPTFNYKLNGKSVFTLTEIQKIKERYNLTPEELDEIFFG